jgi:hypothetical protein
MDTREQHILYAHESDPDLEFLGVSPNQALDQFREKGGMFIRVEETPFALLPGDCIYPACSGGLCRSQVLWTILNEYNQQITLFPPHATRKGYDSYNQKVNWHSNDTEEFRYDEFELWAGQPKTTRFGYDVFASWYPKESASVEELQQIKDYYDVYYYKAPPSMQRRVYLCFDRNTHAILHRLNETNHRLDHVMVVHLPLKDCITNPLPESHTFPRSAKAYEVFSNIIKSHLDLKQIKHK